MDSNCKIKAITGSPNEIPVLSEAVLKSCVQYFSNNQAQNGGGICLSEDSKAMMHGTWVVFIYNSAERGGALHFNNSTVTINATNS